MKEYLAKVKNEILFSIYLQTNLGLGILSGRVVHTGDWGSGGRWFESQQSTISYTPTFLLAFLALIFIQINSFMLQKYDVLTHIT